MKGFDDIGFGLIPRPPVGLISLSQQGNAGFFLANRHFF
jgi:hypothetical protein